MDTYSDDMQMDSVLPSEPPAAEMEEAHHLSVSVKRHPSGVAAVIEIEGHVDHQTVHLLRQRITPLLAAGLRALIFDMSRLKFLSSAGVGVLIHARRTQAAWHGTCHFSNLPPSVRRVFSVMDALPGDQVFANSKEMDRYLTELQAGRVGAADSDHVPAPRRKS